MAAGDDAGPTGSAEAASNAWQGASTAYRQTVPVLIRQPIEPGQRAVVRDRVTDLRPEEGRTDWLVAGDDVLTVSLFLSRDGEDALHWYVETTDTWTDPAATLGERVSSAESGLDELVAGERTVYGDGERVVHAHNPNRPGRPESPDVVLVSPSIETGVGTWLTRALTGLIDVIDDTWVDRKLTASAVEVLEEERMWTETIFVDAPDHPTAMPWYIEAQNMNRAEDAYETTDNALARVSDIVVNWIFETPEVLGDSMDASSHELLCHETSVGRP